MLPIQLCIAISTFSAAKNLTFETLALEGFMKPHPVASYSGLKFDLIFFVSVVIEKTDFMTEYLI